MQNDGKEKKIDGKTYKVFMLPASAGLDLFMDLARIVGPALGVVVDGTNVLEIKEIGDLKITGETFEKVARQIFQAEEKDTVKAAVSLLASQTQVDGQALQPIYDAHFQGSLGTLFKWLAWALEVNFGDFFSAFPSSVAGALGVQGGASKE